MFEDEFQAWKYGPANERVYEVFKQYKQSEIPESEGMHQIDNKDIEETLEVIWKA